ncbi:translocase [Sagittula sp. S175]|uniref:translocase n=1 Tax=Sagittula sp. S175 TaxID=3415129 RepID=UPI003C7E3557
MPKIELPKIESSSLLTQIKERKKSFVLAGATLVCALGVGYVMQYTLPGMSRQAAATGPVDLTGITPTSSSSLGAPRAPIVSGNASPQAAFAGGSPTFLSGAPIAASAAPVAYVSPPSTAPAPIPSETPQVTLAAAEPLAEAMPDAPGTEAATGFACDVTMEAKPAAGALIDVTLLAPCHGAERVTLHHQGMMFTQVMSKDGTLSATLPALSERALVIASFASGAGATAMTDVPTLPLYDRVAVQWKGDAGLGLHAREFGAAYFGAGHVFSGARGDLSATARGDGGFLTVLGDPTSPEALRAEVYSFPKGAATHAGTIALTVEAEITASNCDQTIEAQTLEIREDDDLRTRNLTLEMPGCDSSGDFLVLNNLVEDLTIASR